MSKSEHTFSALARAVISAESTAIKTLETRIGAEFDHACELILNTSGRVIVTGMGKSSHIGSKIAATFSSTGTPAFFMHPGEASHGDMGLITPGDTIVAISKSGQTAEILTLLPLIKRKAIPLITITGNPSSALATAAEVNLDARVEKEACPLGLAPTSSTTAALVMGDALAIALLQSKGFSAEDFAFSHPGGSLGKRLLLHIDDVMKTGDDIPKVHESTPLGQSLLEVTSKKLGITTVINHENKLMGVFTDGDLRRAIDNDINIHTTPISECMTNNVKTVRPGLLAAQALERMESFKITALVVTNDANEPVGIIDLHSLLQAGVV